MTVMLERMKVLKDTSMKRERSYTVEKMKRDLDIASEKLHLAEV